MGHLISDPGDIPPAVPALDRRRTPDRRTVWRGGRRDTDWQNRPLGALDRLEQATRRKSAFLHKALSVVGLW